MTEETSKGVAHAEVATSDEVRAALDGLCKDDAKLNRLKKFAQWRIRGLGRAAEDRTDTDLLNEAIADTLQGDRTWKKAKVDFQGHLFSVIRSISSHWKEQFDTKVMPFSALTVTDSEGNKSSVVDSVAAPGRDPQQAAEDKDLVEKIERLFADDQLVTQLMGCLKSGMTGPEIQSVLSISKNDYETAMRRMRRKARALFPA